ncbi:MAG: DNA mismatch repair protein MutS [Deltaproteobacteria bacterium]|nr:DNA mismatch repair protein MutS [Deltaproteobacteria bacterium]
MKQLTPAMRQYIDIKKDMSDAILFFRMGDFYEMFFEDAVTASRILGITLTSRDRDKEIPMCGVPYHSASSYIAKLVRTGQKVAVCEQVEDPGHPGVVIDRAVTRVITPGVAFDDELLDPKTNNYIASVFLDNGSYGFAYMDASTGEFMATELASSAALIDEIKRIRPLELIRPDSQPLPSDLAEWPVKKVSTMPAYDFSPGAAGERIKAHFGTASADGFGLSGLGAASRSAGALLHYIKETQKADIRHVRKCSPYFTHEYMVMDHATRRNLEIVQNIRTGGREGTLLHLLDKTSTAMGGRRLKSWLLNPLKSVGRIEERQGAVGELVEKRDERRKASELLGRVYDLERLIVRVSLGLASPMDLAALKSSLEAVPELISIISGMTSVLLSGAAKTIDHVPEAVVLIASALVDSPPASSKDGGVIREGYDRTLDELKSVGAGGRDWVLRLEADQKKRTGINSLKVGYNRVFGYYIEVTKANLLNIPADYIRKQTLVNAERFITPELKEWESRILSSDERSKALEASIFNGIRATVAGFADRVHKTADLLATLDALVSLSRVSEEMDYSRPHVNGGDDIEIEGGRHPIVEAGCKDGFVANDLSFGGDGGDIIILTGPNMAGKSTYLRQNALIVLMAQIGCFVPAAKASIGVVDRIFTRVGASDDLSRGQSTFMVEMNETANILNNSTPKSLIILDEIGRGTSTFDGLSIAWAVVEYIHDNPGVRAKTLFATHYHELTELSLTKERVKNYNMAVKEWGEKIIFLRKVVAGGSSRSYGIQVARLAGLPLEVIERAGEILKNLEGGELDPAGMPRIAANRKSMGKAQMSLLGAVCEGPQNDPVRTELNRLDINGMTPLGALTALNKIKGMLDGQR